jgi:hypothetical protein
LASEVLASDHHLSPDKVRDQIDLAKETDYFVEIQDAVLNSRETNLSESPRWLSVHAPRTITSSVIL